MLLCEEAQRRCAYRGVRSSSVRLLSADAAETTFFVVEGRAHTAIRRAQWAQPRDDRVPEPQTSLMRPLRSPHRNY